MSEKMDEHSAARVQFIHDAVREGRISPATGAWLLELRRDLAWRRRHPVLAWLRGLLGR